MKSLFFAITLLSAALAAESARAMAISEVAELQFHKVNQLVDMKKIDSGFVEHLSSVALEKESTGPNFMVTFRQESDPGQNPLTVSVTATPNGRALGFQTIEGVLTAKPADWRGKAPVDLLEKAVEYVVDSTNDALTPPFRDGFTSATITPLHSNQGLIGQVNVTAGQGDGTLLIFVDLNGKILSTTMQ